VTDIDHVANAPATTKHAEKLHCTPTAARGTGTKTRKRALRAGAGVGPIGSDRRPGKRTICIQPPFSPGARLAGRPSGERHLTERAMIDVISVPGARAAALYSEPYHSRQQVN